MATPELLPDKFHPDSNFIFPKTKYGRFERSFQPEWCKKYPWLHYNVLSDTAFCHICITAFHKHKFLSYSKFDSPFTSNGFSNWKNAIDAFNKHKLCARHMEALNSLETNKSGDVGELLCRELKDQKSNNKIMLLKILENIRFLARQGLPLRGNDSDKDSNFVQLINLRILDFPDFKKWIEKKANKYTSPDIQNECLKIMSLQILRRVSENIRNSLCYSIMADECTDISNKEQFTICIRWIDEFLTTHEDYIGFYQVESIDSNTLVNAIKDSLIRMNVNLVHCRGQCYDGAANMSGSRRGVATQICLEEKRAIYTHCYAHSLNLAIGDTIKKSKICSDALDTAYEITKLIKFSPKRNAIFDRIKEQLCDDVAYTDVGIRSFCFTRWTVRGSSISSILENYGILKQLWDECLEMKIVPDVKGRIIGVQTQMSKYNLLFGLKLCERILSITDNLSKTLQKRSLSAGEAQNLAQLTVRTLQLMKTDDEFALFFKLLDNLRQRTDTEEPLLPRRKKAPARFEHDLSESSSCYTIKDVYAEKYFESLNLAISCIQARFDQAGFATYKNLGALLEKAANQLDYTSELDKVLTFHEDDMNELDLSTQLHLFSRHIALQSRLDKQISLEDILCILKSLSEGERCFFNQLCVVASRLLVMPATNATSERSFSLMRNVKNYLRSTMGQSRLNHLMILNIYKNMLDDLDLNNVADEFICGSDHRISIFGNV